MKNSPRDIIHQTFPKAVRGFDVGSVQSYLKELATQWESILQENQSLSMQVRHLEHELAEKREAEENIQRAVVSAEKISFEMRENARKESEQMIADAENRSQELKVTHDQRLAELEYEHQKRIDELEVVFQSRYDALQREHHDTTVAHEHLHVQRTEKLEQQFNDRYQELSRKFSSAHQEYTQFLDGYHALMQSFSGLASRHPIPTSGEETFPPVSDFDLSKIEAQFQETSEVIKGY